METTLPPATSEIATICRGLLEQHAHNYPELIKELAFVAIQEQYGFNELVPEPLPMIPWTLQSYRKMSPEEKKEFISKNSNYFYNEGIGGQYLNKYESAVSKTKQRMAWLIEMRDIFDKLGDIERRDKVNDRLAMFT